MGLPLAGYSIADRMTSELASTRHRTRGLTTTPNPSEEAGKGQLDVLEPRPGPVGGGSLVTAVDPPSAAVGDPAELLDIDMHQLTRAGALVAADHLPGRPVQPGPAVHPAPGQDRMDRRVRQADQRADPGRYEQTVAVPGRERGGERARPTCRSDSGTVRPLVEAIRWDPDERTWRRRPGERFLRGPDADPPDQSDGWAGAAATRSTGQLTRARRRRVNPLDTCVLLYLLGVRVRLR